jgi:hypothetical protein
MDNDIKNLFQHFGASGEGYREIRQQTESEQASGRWPLLKSLNIAAVADQLSPAAMQPATPFSTDSFVLSNQLNTLAARATSSPQHETKVKRWPAATAQPIPQTSMQVHTEQGRPEHSIASQHTISSVSTFATLGKEQQEDSLTALFDRILNVKAPVKAETNPLDSLFRNLLKS